MLSLRDNGRSAWFNRAVRLTRSRQVVLPALTAGALLVTAGLAAVSSVSAFELWLGVLVSIVAASSFGMRRDRDSHGHASAGDESSPPASLGELPDSWRRLVDSIVATAAQPDPVFRSLVEPNLATLMEQIHPWTRGQLVFESTEAWRIAYEAVLAATDITEYRSVAWVKSEDYWQDLPGRQGMQFNYSLLDRGVQIDRILILGWNLWPPELSLPRGIIRKWIEEQHYRGIAVRMVREADLVSEPQLFCDFGIYGERATGQQEIDDDCRTIRFTLSFDKAAVQLGRDRWARLALFAEPYAERLDLALIK